MTILGIVVTQYVALLGDFASEEFQVRQWVNAEDLSIISFFVEDVECLHALDYTIDWMRARGLISFDDSKRVARFLIAIELFYDLAIREGLDPYNNAAIIAHRDWPMIRELAKDAAEELRPFCGSELVLHP